jgi:hypothetical protein
VHRILFNDTKIYGVHTFPGHYNHLHVENEGVTFGCAAYLSTP